ncbi:hypothetical protein ILYODFUR_018824 [Ilyodon furcidens]|uniref:Uncharacterized protein n=1 Tax=Ilyodon furcidens TaxID=33524 RepID=A0ABV0SY85_9TELE
MLVPGRSAQRLRSVRWLSVKHSDALPASFVSGKERTHQHMTFSSWKWGKQNKHSPSLWSPDHHPDHDSWDNGHKWHP